MRALVAAKWEGHVRELRNLIESLVILVPNDEIALEDLPPEYLGGTGSEDDLAPETEGPAGGGEAAAAAGPESAGGANLTMEEIERRAILAALDRTGGNRTQAAEMLGIGLRTLQRKLKEYRLAGKGEGN
jgi:DNA-binding NtrC family response regulator